MWKRIPRKKARKSPEEALAIKKLILRLTFFLGWILSPLTFWNDALVNIPLSYICANLAFRLVHIKFLTLVLIFYWISNGLGLLLMYISGKNIFDSGRGVLREILTLLATIAAYSLLLLILNKAGIIKPF